MFKSYFKTTLRNFQKNKLESFVKLFGLSVGIAASILIFLFAYNELTYDIYHKNGDRIHLIYKERHLPTGIQNVRDTWAPMSQELMAMYPAIEDVTRYHVKEAWVEVKNQKIRHDVLYTDPAFFRMFQFPVIEGDSPTQADPSSVFLSERTALTLFGTKNPIGKTIRVDFQDDLIVRGILADPPSNSSFEPKIVAFIGGATALKRYENNWNTSYLYTFVKLTEGTRVPDLEALFPKFVSKVWPQNEQHLNKTMKLKLLSLFDFHHEVSGAKNYAYVLLMLAGALLVIASINFMNLTIARSLERAGEIGIRKTVGAQKSQLVQQFMGEAAVLSGFSWCVGLCLVYFALPIFNDVYATRLNFRFFNTPLIGITTIFIWLVTTVISGLYPAFLLTRFQPVDTVNRRLKIGGEVTRQGLVVTQFAVAIGLIVGLNIMWNQVNHMRVANLGFDRENIIAIRVTRDDFSDRKQALNRLQVFRNELARHSGVLSLSSSHLIPGQFDDWYFLYPAEKPDDERIRLRGATVDGAFFETYDIDFVEGRTWNSETAKESQGQYIINEAALRAIGWSSIEGKQIRWGSNRHDVIGVVKDFHFESLSEDVGPLMFRFRSAHHRAFSWVSIRVAPGQTADVVAHMKTLWQTVDPSGRLQYQFMDEKFDRLYKDEDRLIVVTGTFTLLALGIAAMGLFALASIAVMQRTKEVAVRKVLGAPTFHLTLLLSKSLLKLVGLANVIAWPVMFYAMQHWLENFAYRVDLSVDTFIWSGCVTLFIALVSVSYHAVKAALANPVDALKYE